MKLLLTATLIICIHLLLFSNCSIDTMVKVIKAISEVHHFDYYILISSYEKSKKLLRENSIKSLHSQLRFSKVIDIHIDEYVKTSQTVANSRRSKCLKIFNGQTEMSKIKFLDVSNTINFGDRDVWLMFLDATISTKKYLKSLPLPFNSQLILAIIQNSTHIYFKAPYRAAENLPLRIPNVGKWTETEGLNLPVIDVALTRKDFEGFQLRAGTWNYPPVTIVNYDKNGRLRVDGYLAEVWNQLSERLNFSYVYHLSEDDVTGSMSPNGTWTGLLGMLIRNEIDVAVIQVTMTSDRIDFIDFCVPIMSAGNKIFYLDTGNQFEWGNFFLPLHIEVWLAILLSLIVFTISLTFFHAIGCSYNIENYLFKQEYTILGSFLIVFRAFTNQGNVLTPESAPSRIVFFSAYLTMAVVLPSYSAALISYLTIQTPYKPFDSFETMLKAGTHMLATSRESADINYFSKSTTPLVKDIFEKLMSPLEKTGQLPRNPKKGIELVCKNKKLAFFGNYLSSTMYAEDLFLKHGCKVIPLENSVIKVHESLAFRKGSPYALAINLELKKMVFSGLLRRFEKQFYLRKKENDFSGYENITMRHVIQIQCLLFGGYILSVVIFVMEIFSIRKRNFATSEKDSL